MNLLILILLILFLISVLKKTKIEFFCQNNENSICKFTNIELPVESSFTISEVKVYGESWAKDLYNNLFNHTSTIVNDAFNKNINLEKYLLNICYINKTTEVDGIIGTLNHILKEKYNSKTPINKLESLRSYFSKLQNLRYNLFYKIFDEENEKDGYLIENDDQNINFSIIKFNIIYLLLDEQLDLYLDNYLRHGIYMYIYDKNVFEIKEEYQNDMYEHLLQITINTIKKYLEIIFNNNYNNLDNIKIIKVRNLIINNSIIDYFSLKKDLCYI